MPSSTSKLRKFRPYWTLQYALAVAERDVKTGSPTKAVCLMCRVFERDETEGAKRRKRKTKIHCYTQPWRPDNMRRHLEQQHALRWTQYKDLSDEDKRRFFPANVAISTRPRDVVQSFIEVRRETSPRIKPNYVMVEAVKKPATFLVDKDIVDELLRAVESEDDEFSCFEKLEIGLGTDDEDLELDVDDNEARYAVTVDSKLELETCIKLMAGGVSLKQAAQLYRGMMEGISARNHTSAGCRLTTEKQVANLCRVACAVNLQKLKEVLVGRDVWAFAVVLEHAECAGSPFLDVRVRFEHDGKTCSVHLVGIVLQDFEMAKESGDLVARYLDVVVPQWKSKLIGVSCLNEDRAKVRGCTQEIINRLATECEGPIFSDYSLSVKLDRLMCEVCRAVLTTEFTNTLMSLIRHLRSRKLDASQCPKMVEGSWESVVKTLQWLVANQTLVMAYTDRFQYAGVPQPEWWIIALVVTNVAGRVDGILRQIRAGKGLFHDRQHLVDLMNYLSMMTGALGPFLPSEYLSISCEDIVIGSFSLTNVAIATFLKAQGNFASNVVDSLEPRSYQALVDVTSTFVLTVLAKLNQIISECYIDLNSNLSRISIVDKAPASLPSVLCKMRHQDFVEDMLQQKERLERWCSSELIEKIEAQHRALRSAYLLEKRVRDELDGRSHAGSFSEAWGEGVIAGIDCRELRYFSGAFAAMTSSPTARSTDSGFALVNWRKIPFSQSITNFSLEAILHAQDYCSLAYLRKPWHTLF